MDVEIEEAPGMPVYKNSEEYRKCWTACFDFCMTHVKSGKRKVGHDSC